MSEGTAQRRVGLAQGPGVQRARPGALCSVAAQGCCNCLSLGRTKAALCLTERHYAMDVQTLINLRLQRANHNQAWRQQEAETGFLMRHAGDLEPRIMMAQRVLHDSQPQPAAAGGA